MGANLCHLELDRSATVTEASGHSILWSWNIVFAYHGATAYHQQQARTYYNCTGHCPEYNNIAKHLVGGMAQEDKATRDKRKDDYIVHTQFSRKYTVYSDYLHNIVENALSKCEIALKAMFFFLQRTHLIIFCLGCQVKILGRGCGICIKYMYHCKSWQL